MDSEEWIYLRPIYDNDKLEGKLWASHQVLPASALKALKAGFARDEKEFKAKLGPYETLPRVGHHLDCGGPISRGAKVFTTEFHGLSLSIYAIHVEFFLSAVDEAKPRLNRKLIGLSSWPVSFLLPIKWRGDLRDWLKSILPEALAFSDAENLAYNTNLPGRNVLVTPRKVRGMAEA